MTKHFVLNKFNHYLIVNGEINTGAMEGCKFFANASKLYIAAAEATKCTLDEIHGNEIILVQTTDHNDKHSVDSWKEFSAHDGQEVILDTEYPTIEQYIREWIC
ncbi:conserved hypothetical protein [Vibrio chagasii]|nr:conserved hypothetical protein [Vibrio chagasii]